MMSGKDVKELGTEAVSDQLTGKLNQLNSLGIEQVLEVIPDPACVIDNEFTVLMVNSAFSLLFGKDGGQVAGGNCYEVFFGTQCGTSDCLLTRISDQDSERIEEDTIKNDRFGEPFSCRVTAVPLRLPGGNLIGIVESCHDMSEFLKAEEERKDNLQFLVTLLDTIPHPVFFKDAEGTFQGCNEVFAEQIFGLPREEDETELLDELPSSVGANLPEIYHREDERLLTNPGTCSYETRLVRADGSERDFILNKATFSDTDGNAMGIVGVLLDVTEMNQMKEKVLLQNKELKEALHIIQTDLEAAAKAQRSLLPSPRLRIPAVTAAWHFEPCSAVGGDLLNILPLDDSHVGFYVLDVAGHGVQAALLSVTLSRLLTKWRAGENLLVTSSGEIRSPEEVVNLLNIRFQIEPENSQYFTILYGILDTKNATVSYASAGHQPALACLPDGTTQVWLEGDKPVGWRLEERFTCYTKEFPPGSRLFLFSDGLIEAFNPERTAIFGRERIERLIRETRLSKLKDAVQSIVVSAQTWSDRSEPEDDVTVLAIEYTKP